jgi:hypothetical protein
MSDQEKDTALKQTQLDLALCRVAGTGNVGLAEYLLKCGANPCADDDAALGEAALNGDVPMLTLLFDAGANPHARDCGALRVAIAHRHRDAKTVISDAMDAAPSQTQLADLREVFLSVTGNSLTDRELRTMLRSARKSGQSGIAATGITHIPHNFC